MPNTTSIIEGMLSCSGAELLLSTLVYTIAVDYHYFWQFCHLGSVCHAAWPSNSNLINWDCFRVNPLLASSVVFQSPLLHCLWYHRTIEHILHF